MRLVGLICYSRREVDIKDFNALYAELVTEDIVRHEFRNRRFELKNIAAVLAGHFHISNESAEELLDKACACVIFEEADKQKIPLIDWVTVDTLVEARPHLHPIEAARLIDKARAELEKERREEGKT